MNPDSTAYRLISALMDHRRQPLKKSCLEKFSSFAYCLRNLDTVINAFYRMKLEPIFEKKSIVFEKPATL